MKVYVSVDMEGISGLTDPEDMRPGGASYPQGREFMTADANAAIAGAYASGATEVLVNDSHGNARNLLVDQIDRRCRLTRGLHKPMRMGQGLDAGFAAALYVGYHARAGTPQGVLNHTWMGKEIQQVWLNGQPAGEIRLMAGLAGSLGVPVALVTGDQAACDEARELLGGVETVAVKQGIDRFSAELLPPEVAQARIREATARSLSTLDRRRPYVVPTPVTLGVEWNSTTIAATCALIPGVRPAGGRTVEYTAQEYGEVVRVLAVMSVIALQVGQQAPYG